MSRKSFGAQSAIFPMPVLIIGTWNADGTANAMNAAWGGIHDTNQIGICLSRDHKTTENLLARRAFTVSMGTVATAVVSDYVGMVSGNDVPDKIARAGLHAAPAENVDAPIFAEYPMTLECRLVSYDENSGYTIADIVNITADESILGADGNIDADKLAPLAFDPIQNVYRVLGGVVAHAFQDGLTLQEKA